MPDGQRIVLYGTDMPDGGCVQVWESWPYDVPKPGDVIRLSDGDWEVDHRLFDVPEDAIEVYAHPPEGARGRS